MKTYAFLMLGLMATTAAAQGKFSTENFNGYTVHIYQPADAGADGALIVESRTGVVVLNPSDEADFTDYLSHMTKPVAQRVNVATLPKGSTQDWNGVSIVTNVPIYGSGDESDVLIGRDMLLVHALPAMKHADKALIGSAADIDRQLTNATLLANKGCSRYVDTHGTVADSELTKFLQKYYSTMKKAYKKSSDAAGFVAAMEKAFPKLDGESDLQEVAAALF